MHFSWFWRLELHGKGARMVRFWCELSFALQAADFLLCPNMGGRGWGTLWGLFSKGTNLMHEGWIHPHDLSTYQRPAPNIITLVIRIWTYEYFGGGGGHKHSMYSPCFIGNYIAQLNLFTWCRGQQRQSQTGTWGSLDGYNNFSDFLHCSSLNIPLTFTLRSYSVRWERRKKKDNQL